MKIRTPSLFWTFAGMFLAVLVAAAVFQSAALIAVVRPLVSRSDNARAELLVQNAAAQIQEAWSQDPEASVREFLGPVEGDDPMFLMLLDAEGNPLRPGRGGGSRPGRALGFPPERRLERDDRILARQAIVVNGVTRAEVAAVRAGPHFGLLPRGAPWLLLVFIPVALLVSGAAALFLFRRVVRRIRALEALALQVEGGDLTARVPVSETDELGRLAEGMNRMTASMADSRHQLEATARERQRLFADITHELSTPLTSIRGFAETLLNPDVQLTDAERGKYLEFVLHESRQMDMLIQDLLELNRLEAGSAELELERLDWAALVRNTVERFRPRFQESGITLDWKGPEAPAWVQGDGRRLEQVLDNLLNNALKHVPQGSRVRVDLVPAPGASGEHQLVVEDDGSGFPPEALPHLFERFYRADPARSAPGSGLGLAIVNEIVARHRGRCVAENRDGGGARIRVYLHGA